MPTTTFPESKPCPCSCGCHTMIPDYRPTCTFCFWTWHQHDPRRYFGAHITAGLSLRALRKAHPNQLRALGIGSTNP